MFFPKNPKLVVPMFSYVSLDWNVLNLNAVHNSDASRHPCLPGTLWGCEYGTSLCIHKMPFESSMGIFIKYPQIGKGVRELY